MAQHPDSFLQKLSKYSTEMFGVHNNIQLMGTFLLQTCQEIEGF